ncbi:MAG: GIY-YIG nuclease family protein [Candidatus Thorarchaeota archaeon]
MTNKDWFLYVVECRDGSLYTGITTDVNRRIREHNSGRRGAKYTRSRRPVKLLMFWPVGNHSDALKAERAFKSNSRNEKLRLLKERKWKDT